MKSPRTLLFGALLSLFFALSSQGLDRPEVTFKVYQFGRDEIPRIDGDPSDWAKVPDSYVVGTDQMTDDDKKNPGPNPKSLDIRVKVGWVKGLNRLYFLYEAYDDFWDFQQPNLHNDTFELMVDGDASGGSIATKHLKRYWTPEEVGGAAAVPDARITDAQAYWAAQGTQAQNYHIMTPAVGKDWAMAWCAASWVKDFPHANAASRFSFKHGEAGKLTLEFWITPYDYAGPEGPQRAVESQLWENKIIGLSWLVIDYDGKGKGSSGFWRLAGHRWSLGNASRLCAFQLMPREPGTEPALEARWSWKMLDQERRIIAFKDESVGEVKGWKWDFGDGTSSTEQNPVKTYTKSEVIPVIKLEVTGPAGTSSRIKLMEIAFP